MPRKSIPAKQQKIVIAAAGGVCSFVGCGRRVVELGSDGQPQTFTGELAHIVGQSRQGPRGRDPLPEKERDLAPNLMLLCERHHKIVDDQKEVYSVQVLREMKRLAERPDAAPVLGPAGSPVTERLDGSLLPVTHLPAAVFSAPCGDGDRDSIYDLLRFPHGGDQVVQFLIREGRIYTFTDLNDPAGPFRDAVRPGLAQKYRAEQMWDDADGFRRYVELLNRSVGRVMSVRGLRYDRDHRRHYFPPESDGGERTYSYQPLNQRRSTKKVAYRPVTKATGEGKRFWYHLAVGLRFERLGSDVWALSIRPERHVTLDGEVPLAPDKIGPKVTKLKAKMRNHQYLSEVQFWRDVLTDGAPRLNLDFGGADGERLGGVGVRRRGVAGGSRRREAVRQRRAGGRPVHTRRQTPPRRRRRGLGR